MSNPVRGRSAWSTALGRDPRLLRAAPAIVYALAIFIGSSVPGSEIPPLGFSLSDKLIHFIEFGILGILLYRAFSRMSRPYLLTVITGALYAASDEFHQLFVPGRQCDFWDFAADVCGILLVGGIQVLFVRRRAGGKGHESMNAGG